MSLVILTAFSTVFVVSYIHFSYTAYLNTYQKHQLEEIDILDQKVEGILKNLKKLLKLSGVRISNILERASQHKMDAIQEILRTLPNLQDQSMYLPIQKIVFYKLSSPRRLITRLGAFQLDMAKAPIEQMLAHSQKSMFSVDNQLVTGRTNILNSSSKLEGILEIVIELSEFKKLLGDYQTIEINKNVDVNQNLALLKIQSTIPFPIYVKKPDSFWSYTSKIQSEYLIFIVYLPFLLLLSCFCLRFMSRHYQKNYHHRIRTLESSLHVLEREEKTMRADFLNFQKDFEYQNISYQAYKSFQERLKNNQVIQLINVVGFLSELQSLKNSLSSVIGFQKFNKLDTCHKQLLTLTKGLWYPTNQENINFKKIIQNVFHLFAYKIHQSNILHEISLPHKLPQFLGDPLLFELILINLIGKSIYRVPDNGIISISLKRTPVFYRVEIKDNGYDRMLFTESLIKKSCDIFLDEDIFSHLCNENGLYIKYSKRKNGFNITTMIIPLPSQGELPKTNVVQLFK